MTVRVFGGWEYDADDVLRPDFAKMGYLGGVPMGGDLTNAPEGMAPNLMIRTLRDPDRANLDRVQVIKGWLDFSGKTQERVYDVVCSDDRKINEAHCERAVGNTVNIEAATYTNNIGDSPLMAFWEDPDFDTSQRAFYYVRMFEFPTPRWTTHDAAFYNIDPPKVFRIPAGSGLHITDLVYAGEINNCLNCSNDPSLTHNASSAEINSNPQLGG